MMSYKRNRDYITKPMEGYRFNYWTVLHRCPEGYSMEGRTDVKWVCKCDCGLVRPVNGQALRKGTSKSCGCLGRIKQGDRFGFLVTQERFKDKRTKKFKWSCLCDCGEITEVTVANLMTKHTVSCGCYRDKIAALRPINQYPDSQLRSVYLATDLDRPHLFKVGISIDHEDRIKSVCKNPHCLDFIYLPNSQACYLEQNILDASKPLSEKHPEGLGGATEWRKGESFVEIWHDLVTKSLEANELPQ